MIRTARLRLVPATLDSTRAALVSGAALAAALGALVPDTWPPQFLDADALQFTLERLAEGGGEGWWLYFVLLASDPPTLIGTVYGMNFSHIPELRWFFGYPFAIGLMLCVSFTLYLIFKHRDWL